MAADRVTTEDEHNQAQNRIIKKFGGRHLIFRTEPSKWRVFPKPYVLVSSFRGPIWVFYGVGQLWLTHKKFHEIGGWMARTPRVRSQEVTQITESIEPELAQFIEFCNEHGIEGTVLIEKEVIEFHWTFGFELEKESGKEEHAEELESHFQSVVDAYQRAKLQLQR